MRVEWSKGKTDVKSVGTSLMMMMPWAGVRGSLTLSLMRRQTSRMGVLLSS